MELTYFIVFLHFFVCLQAKTIHLTYSRNNGTKYEVLYSNGVVKLQTLDPSWEACSIQNQYVSIRWNGKCTDETDFNIKWGSVNQISLEAERTNYVGSTLTIIHVRMIENIPIGHALGAFRAIARGQPGAPTDIQTVSGTVSCTRYVVDFIQCLLQADTTITTNADLGIFCNPEGTCTTRPHSGPSAETWYYGVGMGEFYMVFGLTASAPYAPDVLNGNIEQYLPTANSIVPEYPIGIIWDSWLRSGAMSEQYSQAINRATSSKRRRRKRFATAAWAASLEVRINQVTDAAKESFALADQNMALLGQAMTRNEQYAKDLGNQIIQTQEIAFETKKTVQILNLQNGVIESVIRRLSRQADNLEDFVMYVLSWITRQPVLEQADKDALDQDILNAYPGARITYKSYTAENAIYTLTTNESLTEGTLPSTCSISSCFLQTTKPVFKWVTTGKIREVDSPVLNSYTCGVFVENPQEPQVQAMEAMPNAEKVRDYCQQQNLRWSWVNPLSCPPEEFQLENTYFGKAARILEEAGAGQISLYVDERFHIECNPNVTELNENGTLSYSKFIADQDICSAQASAQDLRDFVNSIKVTRYNLAKVVDVFNKLTDFDSFLTKWGEAIEDGTIDVLTGLASIPAGVWDALQGGALDRYRLFLIIWSVYAGVSTLVILILIIFTVRVWRSFQSNLQQEVQRVQY